MACSMRGSAASSASSGTTVLRYNPGISFAATKSIQATVTAR